MLLQTASSILFEPQSWTGTVVGRSLAEALFRAGSFIECLTAFWFPPHLKWRHTEMPEFPWRRCHGSRAYQVWAGFSEAADQFREPTNLWAGNRNEQIHLQVKKKKHRVRQFFYFPDMWCVTSSTSGCCYFAVRDTVKCCAAIPWSKKRQITFKAC